MLIAITIMSLKWTLIIVYLANLEKRFSIFNVNFLISVARIIKAAIFMPLFVPYNHAT